MKKLLWNILPGCGKRLLCLGIDSNLPAKVCNSDGKRVLFAGDAVWTDYMLDRLCPSEKTCTPVENWNPRKGPHPQGDACDAVVLRVNDIYGKKLQQEGFVKIPEWVSCNTTLGKMTEAGSYFSELAKTDRKGFVYRIERAGYDDLGSFYDLMYVPYVKNRFGSQAYVEPLAALKALKGSLLSVRKTGERDTAAVLCYFKKGVLHFGKIGVLDGDFEFVKQGALEAVYYYFAEYFARSFPPQTRVAMGLTRAFEDDGVLTYKKKWGCVPEKHKPHPYNFYLRFKENTDKEAFLAANPVVKV